MIALSLSHSPFYISLFLSIWYFLLANRMSLHTFYHPVYIHSHDKVAKYVCFFYSCTRLIYSSCFDTFEESFWMTELFFVVNSRVYSVFWLSVFLSMQTSESAALMCVVKILRCMNKSKNKVQKKRTETKEELEQYK